MSWYREFSATINSGQSNSIVLHGEVSDLQKCIKTEKFKQIIPVLTDSANNTSFIPIVLELNGPIRISKEHYEILLGFYKNWDNSYQVNNPFSLNSFDEYPGIFSEKEFKEKFLKAIGNPTYALEFLRQLCVMMRYIRDNCKFIRYKLAIVIESSDFILPNAENISNMKDNHHRRISIVKDWLSDCDFIDAKDSVTFITESLSNFNQNVSSMPNIKAIEVPLPSYDLRKEFLNHLNVDSKHIDYLASNTSGISLYGIRQLIKANYRSSLKDQRYEEFKIKVSEVVGENIVNKLGPGVIEFKKPTHTLEDIVGNTLLKEFFKKELIPRFLAKKEESLVGAAVAGPIGSGKTHCFEAVASELKIPVIVLKNIRSQYFGQTDVIFEKLYRILISLDKVLIFIDEADTQFGGVGQDIHETERRLTGKLQAMMSDSSLKGKVLWLLMTARINSLSPDLRREGRSGDLIIPVLDPEGKDRMDFINWMLPKEFPKRSEGDNSIIESCVPDNFSAAAFSSLRSYLKWKKPKTLNELQDIIKNIKSNSTKEREQQKIDAIMNCSRMDLLSEANRKIREKR